MSALYEKRWANTEVECLLTKFAAAYDAGEYTEKIPYDKWREIRKQDKVIIQLLRPYHLKIIGIKSGGERFLIYTTKIYDNGFGRFFYETELKGEVDMTVMMADGTTKQLSDTYSYYPYDNKSDVSNVFSGSSSTTITLPNDYWLTSDRTTAVTTDYCDNLTEKIQEILNNLNDTNKKDFEKKENDSTMKGFNFDFGPCGNSVRLSMYGMAIQNVTGEWVSYNADSNEIINVDVLNIPDGGKYMYKMPVAISEVKVGDVVIHNRVPMFVTKVNESGNFEVTDVRAGESKSIIPTRNMFGFNFMTKVVSLFNAFNTAPTADQPFGNMLPFLMMNDENGKDLDPMVFMMMSQNAGAPDIFANPMMMYFLMKDRKDVDPMLMMALMGGFGNTKKGE